MISRIEKITIFKKLIILIVLFVTTPGRIWNTDTIAVRQYGSGPYFKYGYGPYSAIRIWFSDTGHARQRQYASGPCLEYCCYGPCPPIRMRYLFGILIRMRPIWYTDTTHVRILAVVEILIWAIFGIKIAR